MTETSRAVCRTCEAPARTLWPPDPVVPDWEEMAFREWMTLLRRRRCGQPWVWVPHVRAHRRRSKGRAPFDENEPPKAFDLAELRKRVLGGDR